MKVARVCPYYYAKKENLDSGLKPYYYNLVNGLKQLGVENDIYTLESDSSYRDNVFIVKKRKRFSYLLFGYDIYRKIKSTRREYNVIHTHQPNSFLLYFFKKKFKSKFVHTIHGSPLAYKKVPIKNFRSFIDVWYFYLFNRYICKKADFIITVSSEAKKEVESAYGVSEDKVFFIPTGVDFNMFKPMILKKRFDILYVGRFVVKKNLPLLIDVVKDLTLKYPSIKVLFLGGSESDSDYFKVKGLIAECNLDKNIFVHSSVNQGELVRIYNQSKVFVLLSYEEGMPKVLLEALSCGIPAVVTNNSGMRDVIINGKNGVLVDINKADIVDEISIALNGKYSFNKKLTNKFSWKAVVGEVYSLYLKLS